jgi:hypothetical protein
VALFRVLHTDGTKVEVATTMGDSMMAERRGLDLQKQGLEGGLATVYVALARAEQRPPLWSKFVEWTNTVDMIEADGTGGEPDPTRPAAPDTP